MTKACAALTCCRACCHILIGLCDHLWHAAHFGGHHQQAHAGRLHDGHAEGLCQGGIHKDLALQQEVPRALMRHGTNQCHLVTSVQQGDQGKSV